MQASRNTRANLISVMAKVMLLGIWSEDERRLIREQLLGPVLRAGVGLSAATATVDVVLIRLLGARHLVEGDVPDHVLAWARVYHLFGLRNYMAAHEAGSLPDIVGIDFSVPDFDKLIQSACLHVLTAVGMAVSLGDGEMLPAPLFNPDKWREGWSKVDVKWQVQPIPILMPDGRQQARLQITVSDATS